MYVCNSCSRTLSWCTGHTFSKLRCLDTAVVCPCGLLVISLPPSPGNTIPPLSTRNFLKTKLNPPCKEHKLSHTSFWLQIKVNVCDCIKNQGPPLNMNLATEARIIKNPTGPHPSKPSKRVISSLEGAKHLVFRNAPAPLVTAHVHGLPQNTTEQCSILCTFSIKVIRDKKRLTVSIHLSTYLSIWFYMSICVCIKLAHQLLQPLQLSFVLNVGVEMCGELTSAPDFAVASNWPCKDLASHPFAVQLPRGSAKHKEQKRRRKKQIERKQ